MLKTFKIGALFDIHPTNANSATTTASAAGVQREFKNYRITDYFVVRNTHSIPKEEVRFGGSRPYVTAGSSDNSVAGYIDYDESLLEEGNSIMVGGKTAVVTYQPCDYFSNDSHNLAVFPKNSAGRTELAQLFIASALQKSLGAKYSWGDSVSYRKIQKDVVSLPAGSDGEPDFAYMEERIAELEEERIAELDAYLVASGLDDYELTDEDKEILSLSPESASDEAGASEADFGHGQVRFKRFALGDVFNIYSPKKRFNANTVQFGGKYPYVARGSSNNGIRGYITEDKQYLSPAKSLSFGQDTATVFYQPDAYFTGDKIKVMVLNNHDLNDELAQYFITVITKRFSTFAWGQSSFNEKILKATEIVLPVIGSPDPDHEYTVDDIDFDYMERYIRAIEKLTIADVAKHKDKLIEMTRQIVGA